MNPGKSTERSDEQRDLAEILEQVAEIADPVGSLFDFAVQVHQRERTLAVRLAELLERLDGGKEPFDPALLARLDRRHSRARRAARLALGLRDRVGRACNELADAFDEIRTAVFDQGDEL